MGLLWYPRSKGFSPSLIMAWSHRSCLKMTLHILPCLSLTVQEIGIENTSLAFDDVNVEQYSLIWCQSSRGRKDWIDDGIACFGRVSELKRELGVYKSPLYQRGVPVLKNNGALTLFPFSPKILELIICRT